MAERATFYYDLGSPYAYLSAERISGLFTAAGLEQPEWQPILLGGLFRHFDRGSWALTEARAEGIAEIEERAARYGLPPLVWPDPWPGEMLMAMRVATFAKQTGRTVSFSLAAFRQQFAAAVGQVVVEQRDLDRALVGHRAAQHGECVGQRGGLAHVHAVGGEAFAQDAAVERQVVHQQDVEAFQFRRQRARLVGALALERNHGVEGGALVVLALEADVAAHEFGQRLADGEPEPGAAETARGGGVGLLEALEQPGHLLPGQADARVAHLEAQQHLVGILLLDAHHHADLAVLGELDGVVGVVDEDLAQAQRVAHQVLRHVGRQVEDQLQVLDLRLVGHRGPDPRCLQKPLRGQRQRIGCLAARRAGRIGREEIRDRAWALDIRIDAFLGETTQLRLVRPAGICDQEIGIGRESGGIAAREHAPGLDRRSDAPVLVAARVDAVGGGLPANGACIVCRRRGIGRRRAEHGERYQAGEAPRKASIFSHARHYGTAMMIER